MQWGRNVIVHFIPRLELRCYGFRLFRWYPLVNFASVADVFQNPMPAD